MKSFARILTFVWPQRRRLMLSFLFAGMVAFLWSVAILLTFPVMKILLQDQTLAEYVDQEIALTEADLDERDQRVDELHERRKDTADPSTLRKQAREHNKLGTASWKLFLLNSVRDYIIPLVPEDLHSISDN